MALEQLRVFREGRPQESLGAFERLEPDGFPRLASSELAEAHRQLSPLIGRFGYRDVLSMERSPEILRLLGADGASRTALYLALIERMFAYSARLCSTAEQTMSEFYDHGVAARIMTMLFKAGVDEEIVAEPTLEWFNSYRFVYYGTEPVRCVLSWAEQRYCPTTLPTGLRERLIAVRGQCADLGGYEAYGGELMKDLDKLLGAGPWQTLVTCEVWAKAAQVEIETLSKEQQHAWSEMLVHCGTAASARPSPKWLKAGHQLLTAIGVDAFGAALLRWFPLVNQGRNARLAGISWENVDEDQRMHEVNAVVLRGLLWMTPAATSPELVRAIGRLTLSAYRKVRGIGPRATKVGNACIYALSMVSTEEALGQLALLKVRVKFGTAQKEIEKAFNASAEALGLPRDQIEEMGVPTYGLEEVGVRREVFGDASAELRIDGRDVEIRWTSGGKPVKSVPAKVKADHKEDLKELQGTAKDIAAMLPAQAERIDSMFLLEKRWPIATWRERYIEHPLVGTLARRLIWTSGGESFAWLDGKFVDASDKLVEPAAEAEVALWHPIGRPTDEVLAWRAWTQRHEIVQPFKQAHRELYLLTDAERRTNTYSNRFAAHILRQHQFNALCAARGWKNKLRLMVDDTYPPASRELPQWGLRAEFWIEGIGDDHGTDTTESGAYLRVATDQVRFYRIGAADNVAHAGGGGYGTRALGTGENDVNAPLPLDQIPALVLSEILRDVDLFVGVGSVGNDPTWQDGGPGGRYREYWHGYSFGELGETSKTRKGVLESILPRLTKLNGKWRLDDRFLIIRGSIRSYKIHLGSGNILMLPNDQYLCIVPDRSRKSEGSDVFLPFEGDATLSIILSKAFLLADDAKIKDETIIRQIRSC